MTEKPQYGDYTDEMAHNAIPDMAEAVESLDTYYRTTTIATLTMPGGEAIPVGAMHAFAEMAESIPNTILTTSSSGLELKRTKTNDAMVEQVIASWRSDSYYKAMREWEKDETARKANANVEGL